MKKEFEIYKNGTQQGTVWAKNKREAEKIVFAIYCEQRMVYPIKTVKILTEEDNIIYKELKELSYYETGIDNVDLYVKGEFIGEIKVWLDSEMEDREYITINYEIIYLDTIEKINPE